MRGLSLIGVVNRDKKSALHMNRNANLAPLPQTKGVDRKARIRFANRVFTQFAASKFSGGHHENLFVG